MLDIGFKATFARVNLFPLKRSAPEPVVKVSNKKGQIVKNFYSVSEYINWKEKEEDLTKYSFKYYKGLGTSTSREAKEYFSDLRVVKYSVEGGGCDDSIDLAFNKKRADDRKTWLQNYDSSNVLDPDSLEVSYREFIHKELIHFSNEDLRRSVPSICDGLPSAPNPHIIIKQSIDPNKDRWAGSSNNIHNPNENLQSGMSIVVTIPEISKNKIRWSAYSENTIRGAAGGCVLLAEIDSVKRGLIQISSSGEGYNQL